MRKPLAIALAVAAVAVASPAAAGRTETLKEFPNETFTPASGKAPTPAEVRGAIVAAATERGWTTEDAGPQLLTATLVVRNKHTIAVNVSYAPQSFSVTYKSSVNMNFEQQGADRFIHPNYNKWTKSLVDAIRAEASKL
jgi:hypothetical protein